MLPVPSTVHTEMVGIAPNGDCGCQVAPNLLLYFGAGTTAHWTLRFAEEKCRGKR